MGVPIECSLYNFPNFKVQTLPFYKKPRTLSYPIFHCQYKCACGTCTASCGRKVVRGLLMIWESQIGPSTLLKLECNFILVNFWKFNLSLNMNEGVQFARFIKLQFSYLSPMHLPIQTHSNLITLYSYQLYQLVKCQQRGLVTLFE